MKQKSKKIMIQGNEASGLGCVFAGATVASWYPITPSTSLAEALKNMFICSDLIQMEILRVR